jgi:hypothetical protein
VLVEGLSDQAALEALAARLGRDLESEGVTVQPIGGAQAIATSLTALLSDRRGRTLAGLCDAGEEREFRRALERVGIGAAPDREAMERLGFYVCERDLEDELIRSLGTAAVEEVIRAQGDLRSFRTLQKQPAQRVRTTSEQLHRFMGSGGGRKIEYARLLVEALDLDRVPRPLQCVLEHVAPRD